MNATSEELVDKIRHSLPMAKTITDLEVKATTQAVSFRWQGHQFIVLPSMEVFELRGNNLFVTGASALIYLLLANRAMHGKVLSSVVDVLQEAEDHISSQRRMDSGMKLVAAAKSTLERLSGSKRPISTNPPSFLASSPMPAMA